MLFNRSLYRVVGGGDGVFLSRNDVNVVLIFKQKEEQQVTFR